MSDSRANVPKIRFPGFTDPWKQRRFDSVFDFIPNNTLSRADLNYDDGKVKNVHYGDILIKYGAVIDCSKDVIPFITGAKVSDYQSQLLQEGDVLIADAAEDKTVGKATEIAGISSIPVVSGLHTIACRPKVIMQPNYLGYYMNSPSYHRQLLPLMQGIKVLSVSRTNLAKTTICYPASAREQLQIGSLFRNLDSHITLHQRKLNNVKKLKTGLLQKMFPKKGESFPEVRFPGFTDAWKQRKVSDITLFHKQGFYTTEKYDENKKYYLLRGTDLTENKLVLKDTPKINATEKDYKDFKTQVGDFLIVRSGTVGTYGIVDVDIPAIFGSYLINFRFDTSLVTNEFFGYFYQSDLFKNQLRKIIQQSANTNINAENIKSTIIKLPCIEEQRKIGQFFERLDQLITLHQRKLDHLQEQKKSLLQQMFV